MNAIPQLKHTDSGLFTLIAGPCAIEGEGMAMDIAGEVSAIADRLGLPYIFKGSYRKANRSRLDSFTGSPFLKTFTMLQITTSSAACLLVTP